MVFLHFVERGNCVWCEKKRGPLVEVVLFFFQPQEGSFFTIAFSVKQITPQILIKCKDRLYFSHTCDVGEEHYLCISPLNLVYLLNRM